MSHHSLSNETIAEGAALQLSLVTEKDLCLAGSGLASQGVVEGASREAAQQQRCGPLWGPCGGLTARVRMCHTYC